jgi:hypothetical protein
VIGRADAIVTLARPFPFAGDAMVELGDDRTARGITTLAGASLTLDPGADRGALADEC